MRSDDESVLNELDEVVASLKALPLRTAGDLSPQDRERMRDMLVAALESGADYRTGARTLRAAFPHLDPDRALTIVWTELARASNAGRVTFYRNSGVKNVRWSSADDERTCPKCRALDDQTAPIDGAFRDGTRPDDIAHERCRCCILAVDI